MAGRKRLDGRLLRIRLTSADRRLLNHYTTLIQQKYGVCSFGLNGLVLSSTLRLMNRCCLDDVALDHIEGRTCLWPVSMAVPLHSAGSTA